MIVAYRCGILVGVVQHFVCETIPTADYPINQEMKKKKEIIFLIVLLFKIFVPWSIFIDLS